jgi:serine phosphatase RsbU (regulator of sigma subunit)
MSRFLLHIFLIFLASFSFKSYSFNTALDSLMQRVRIEKNDSIKCSLYYEILSDLSYDDPLKALDIALEYLSVSQRVGLSEQVSANNQLGIIYYFLGRLNKTIAHFSDALYLAEEVGDKIQASRILNNLALTYGELGLTDKELEYYYRSMRARIANGEDSARMSSIFGNIGVSYLRMKNADSAQKYIAISYNIDKQNKDERNLLYSTASRAELYQLLQAYDSALFYYTQVEQLAIQLGGQSKVLCENHVLKGKLYLEINQPKLALIEFEKAFGLADEFGISAYLGDIYKGMSEAFVALGKFEDAYQKLLKFSVIRDSVLNAETKKQLETAEIQQKEQEIKLLTQQSEIDQLTLQKGRTVLYLFGFIILAILIIALIYYNKTVITQRLNHLLQLKSEQLSDKNEQITNSIQFARGIQEAMFATEEDVKLHFPESFVYHVPSDLVSGDFHWIYAHNHQIIVAVIDCTGHGVPAAFMTMMANSLLNNIVKERQILSPDAILLALHESLVNSWHKSGEDAFKSNGLDGAICAIDTVAKTIDYAGAKRPFFLLSKDKFIEIKGAPFSVGSQFYDDSIHYPIHRQSYSSKDQLILFTDGIIDQFGGDDGKKYMAFRLRALLKKIHQLPYDQQHQLVVEELELWKAGQEQIDDMLLLSITFP